MKAFFTWVMLICSSVTLASSLENIVVFGDSLSDTGNLYSYTHQKMPSSPPYYEGRFSNGPIWVERLSALYFPKHPEAHLANYAFGGAAVDADNDDSEDALFTLNNEINTYFLAHHDKADPNSLFVVWIGANNYFTMPEDIDEAVDGIVGSIKKSLERLVDRGAKHILVLGLPDLGKTPVAREYEIENELTQMSQKHNLAIENMVLQLKQSHADMDWIYFDVYSDFDRIFHFPKQYGLTNVLDTCYGSVESQSMRPQSMLKVLEHMPNTDYHACDGFLYFDPVHPTTTAHQIVAEEIKQRLTDEQINFIEE
ncbi:MAG: lysophospholipase [Legionellaceae bacterium]|nr:lysophospholipase [Legionellaceae bacterium]HCA89352.1 lysophospholipase [Legionellales bacterium]|tara:strand:+ start:409 stop:1341 length:933 start_codon:yes stop_codon:yes gene_type:complete